MKSIMLIFALVLIVGCGTQTEEAIEESVADSAPEVTSEESVGNTDVSDATPAGRYNKEITDLRTKGLQRTSYHYDFSYRVLDNFGNYQTKADYQVFVKGSKTKKAYLVPRKLNLELFYDNLYLDNDAKTAFATCEKGGVLCEGSYEKVYSADYEELPFTGIDLLESIPVDAKIVGTRALYGRTATVLEYEQERLYIDTYFGLPLKHQLYKIEDGEEVILEESMFTRLSDATESDVTIPKDYVLVE